MRRISLHRNVQRNLKFKKTRQTTDHVRYHEARVRQAGLAAQKQDINSEVPSISCWAYVGAGLSGNVSYSTISYVVIKKNAC